MNKVGLVGVTIFYNAQRENIENCINNSKNLDFMVAVVNGVDDPVYDEIKNYENIKVIFLGYNSGIAKATNDAIKWLNLNVDYDFCCLLDQDSLLPDNYSLLVDDYFELEADGVKVGIVAPTHVNPRTGVESVNLLFNKFFFSRKKVEKKIEITSAPIASGSLISKKLFNDIGLLEEKLFIDYVDTEFAFRCLAKGYNNYISSRVKMYHELGNQQVKKILGLKVKPSFHSPIRKYYISRNRLYLISKYSGLYPSLILFEFLAISLDLFRIMVYEDKKIEKIKFIFCGFTDFFRGKFGALS